MRVSLKFAVVSLIITLAMSGSWLTTTGPVSAQGPQRYVVLGAAGALPAGFDAVLAAAGGTVVSRLDEIGAAVVESAEPNFLEAAGAIPGLEGVAEDREILIAPADDGPALEGTEGVALEGRTPANAKFFPFQWNLKAIAADQAWAAGFLGDARVKVAVIDTGIDSTHQEFAGRVSPTLSKSFFTEPLPPGAPKYLDVQGHGSHVAGIIAAGGVSIAGIAPRVTLIAVKVAGRPGFASLATIAEAIVYAANAGADVINMSFGDDLTKSELKADHLKQLLWRAVNYAHSKGVFMAASAGNNMINWDDKDHKQLTKVPAELNHVAGVSATGPFFGAYEDKMGVAPLSGGYVQYSDFGKSIVVFAAPGGSLTPYLVAPPGLPAGPVDMILSVCARFSRSACSSGKAGSFMFGTSMAAAHVSGVAALIDSAYGGSLTGDQILALMKRAAEDLGKPGMDELYGYGRINAYRSLTLK